jgi:hypothetical protein
MVGKPGLPINQSRSAGFRNSLPPKPATQYGHAKALRSATVVDSQRRRHKAAPLAPEPIIMAIADPASFLSILSLDE